jgi:DNA repair protein RecN (Recombination protein N)
MLTELFLQNYILIPELRLRFGQGMTVITGETGAGKSILVGALNLVFGKSAAQQIAFNPAQDVYLEVTFDISHQPEEVIRYLESLGVSVSESELVAAREITVSGKSTSFLNGRKTSLTVLKELHDLLIDFHHQRDQQNLLSPAFQMDLLDSYGNLMPLRNTYLSSLNNLRESLRLRQELQAEQERNRQLCDLYRFQSEELVSAQLRIGEDIELEQEFNLLSHSEEIIRLASEVYNSFYEQDNSLYDTLSGYLAQIRKYSDLSSNIVDLCNGLESCLTSLQDVSSQLRKLQEQIASDPARLEEIRLRLDLINSLKAKYKQSGISELLEYLDKINAFIGSQDSGNDKLMALDKQISQLFTEVKSLADELTERRLEVAARLAADIVKNITQLSLPKARFEIKIDKKSSEEILLTDLGKALSDTGQDIVEFRFSANPGSPMQPLKAIVSGGELSRILLASKQSLASVMPLRTIILDEVDVGIGGKTAGALADFIHKLGKAFQVICITHLARIAAAADSHIVIEKKLRNDSTSIRVENLAGEARINEIARMLSGHITDLSLQHARELLNIKE